MNEVAVIFERFFISEDHWVLKPIDIVEGTYNAYDDMFTTKFGKNYYSINFDDSFELDDNKFFGYREKISKLKKIYDVCDKSMAVAMYFDSVRENTYFGTYDKNGIVKISSIPLTKFNDMDSKAIMEVANYKGIESDTSVSEDKNNKFLNNQKVGSTTKKTNSKRKDINLSKICDKVNENVICQEDAVDIIATTIVSNYLNDNPRLHSHLLVTGPTGVGKTEIINSIAKEINIPFVVTGMESITQTGYVGQSIDTLIAKVYNAANGDIELAQRSILALDEIDKKASSRNSDVAGRAVLNSLLKILDGNLVDVNIGTEQFPEYITFDTSHLTIISIGAFDGIKKFVPKTVGFNKINNIETSNNTSVGNNLFFDYGVPAEYIGRMGVVATLKSLDANSLLKILHNSINSPLLLSKEKFLNYGVEIQPDKSYEAAIVKKALELNVGARGLKVSIESSLIAAQTQILKEKKYHELLVSEETVKDPKQYILK